MRRRWRAAVLVAGGLFMVNVAARLVVRLGPADGRGLLADAVTLVMLAVVGLTCLGLAVWWAPRRPTGRWVADVALGSAGGLLLAVLVGPLVSGVGPFTYGAGEFFKQVWQWGGVTVVGAGLGMGAVTALGRDHRSRSLDRFARQRQAAARAPRR